MPMQVEKLIELAEQRVGGTPTEVANKLGVKPPVVFGWKAGTRTCTAEDRALLADLAGIDPFPEIKEAMLERWAGKPKAEALAKVLAKWGESRIFPRKLARFAARVQALILEPMRNA